jgi:hypothetical protein
MVPIEYATARRSLQDHDCAAASLLPRVEDVPPDGLRVDYDLVIEIEGCKRPACVAKLIACRTCTEKSAHQSMM